jgi:CubicO group peptidase (beta-lactamase class C family)
LEGSFVRQLKKWLVPLLLLVGAGGVLAQDLVPEVTDPAAKAAGAVAGDREPPRGSAGVPLTQADVDTWLDGFMPYAIESGDIAGAVVVVVKDGKVLTQRGFGYADVARRTPVDPETTLFRTGSVSKLTTWTAVMQLVEQGKLDLDTDVNQYIDFTIPDYDGKPITLRNIMTHTAGFQETIRRLISDSPGDMQPLGVYVKENLPDRIFPPGEMPAYSNYATALAGYIIERVSGLSYDDYVERNIFTPLGMTQATFRQPLPAKFRPFMSRGYGPGLGKAEKFEFVVPAPAGSESASGAAMAKFMIAHLNDGAGLMKPETAKQMHDFTLPILPPLHPMALGFYRDDVNGHRVIGHAGDTVYMHTNLDLFLDDGVGLFISMNSDGKAGSPRWVREGLLRRFADRYFPAPLEGTPIDAKTARAHARMLAGTYASSRGFETNFLHMLDLAGQEQVGLDEQGGIVVGSAGNAAGQPRKWIEVAPFVWRDRDSGMRLAAEVKDGKVTRWSFDTVSPFTYLRRVPWYQDTAWLVPVVMAGLGIVLLSALAWPAGAIARRRFKVAGRYEGPRLRNQRILHGLQWLVLLVLAGWATWISVGLSSLSMLAGPLDPLLYALQVLSPIALFGLLVMAGWNLWTARKERRGWFALLWAVLLLFAAVMLVWTALAFHMFGFGTHY